MLIQGFIQPFPGSLTTETQTEDPKNVKGVFQRLSARLRIEKTTRLTESHVSAFRGPLLLDHFFWGTHPTKCMPRLLNWRSLFNPRLEPSGMRNLKRPAVVGEVARRVLSYARACSSWVPSRAHPTTACFAKDPLTQLVPGPDLCCKQPCDVGPLRRINKAALRACSPIQAAFRSFSLFGDLFVPVSGQTSAWLIRAWETFGLWLDKRRPGWFASRLP